MSEERLRLIAEFRDQASAGVRRLGRELGEVRETPGMSAAARWMRGFQVDSERIQRNAAGVGSVMGAMGIGGVAAAGGIAAAVGALKSFADRTIDLQAVSRETGIAMTRLRELQNAAKELHVDPDNITKGVQYLTGQLALARRGYGELFGLLNQVEPEFMRKIMAEDPAKAMDDVLARLARIPDDYVKAGHSLADGIAAQKQWSAALLGDQGLGRLVEQGPQALATAMQNAAKNTAPVTKDMVEAAKAMDASINNLNEKLGSMATKAAPEFFKQVGNIVGEFDQLVTTLDKLQQWWGGAKAGDVANAVGDTVQDQLTLKPRQKYDELHGEGLFAKPESAEAAQARLQAMQAEVDAIKSKLAADKNPVSFPVRHAEDFSRLNELAAALRSLRQNSPDLPPPPQTGRAELLHRSSYGSGNSGLLHDAAYSEDDGSLRGGMGGGLVLEFRDVIASGVKSGFLAAFRELQTGEPAGGGAGGGGGFINASFGGSSPGGGGSSRYRAGGGQAIGGAVAPMQTPQIERAAPGANGFGKINAPYRGGLDAKGEGGQLAPRELFSYLKARGASDNEATMLTGAAGSESSFNPRAVHDGGRGHGLWGHNDQRIDMRGKSWQQQADLALAEVKRDYAERVNAAKTPEDLADAEMHYERPRGYSSRNPRGGDNFTGRLNTLRRFGNELGTMKSTPDQMVPGKTSGVSPVLTDMVARASEILHTSLSVYSGRRTPEHNAAVGGAQNSLHMRGWATDLQAAGHPKGDHAFWERANGAMSQAAREMKQPYRWGGTFGGRYAHDDDHFDLGPNGPSAEALAKHMDSLDQKQRQIEVHQSKTLGAAHRLLGWADRAAETTLVPAAPSLPRKSLLDEANRAGIGSTTVKHEGGAVIEIRGLPQGKGTRTSTSGLIEAVHLRRGSPTTQIG